MWSIVCEWRGRVMTDMHVANGPCGMSSRCCEASGTRGVEANPIFQENGQVCRGANH
jgi:hypothetical protein